MSQGFPFDQFFNQSKKPNISNTLLSNQDNNKSTEALPKEDHTSNFSDLNSYLRPDNSSENEYYLLEQEIHNSLKSSLTTQKYEDFFKGNLSFVKITGNTIHFAVPTNFIKSLVEKQYMPLISTIVEQTLGKKYAIEINPSAASNQLSSLISETEANTKTSQTNARSFQEVRDVKFQLELTPKSQDIKNKAESDYINHINGGFQNSSVAAIVGAMIDKHKTFDTFVVGPSNNMAFATAIAVSSDPGKEGKYPSLYLYSDSGLGKTHLLHAVANGIQERCPKLVVCLITARDFMKEMINHIKNKNLDSFQKKYSEKIDVLMIDDIHELNNKQGTQNEFFHIFNELYNKGKQLIFTSDKKPQEIEGIEERIRTRLQWGLVIDIQRPDIETRLAILKKKANDLDLFIPDDVLGLIASKIKTSIRELEGTLIRLSAHSDFMKVEIDMETAKEVLELNRLDESEKATLESISKVVSAHYKITIADMKSKSRNKDITRARHVAMYLSRKIVSSTQQEIAKFYGNRDHSTVIHAIRTITEKLKNDRDLSRSIIEIEAQL